MPAPGEVRPTPRLRGARPPCGSGVETPEQGDHVTSDLLHGRGVTADVDDRVVGGRDGAGFHGHSPRFLRPARTFGRTARPSIESRVLDEKGVDAFRLAVIVDLLRAARLLVPGPGGAPLARHGLVGEGALGVEPRDALGAGLWKSSLRLTSSPLSPATRAAARERSDAGSPWAGSFTCASMCSRNRSWPSLMRGRPAGKRPAAPR